MLPFTNKQTKHMVIQEAGKVLPQEESAGEVAGAAVQWQTVGLQGPGISPVPADTAARIFGGSFELCMMRQP